MQDPLKKIDLLIGFHEGADILSKRPVLLGRQPPQGGQGQVDQGQSSCRAEALDFREPLAGLIREARFGKTVKSFELLITHRLVIVNQERVENSACSIRFVACFDERSGELTDQRSRVVEVRLSGGSDALDP